MNAAPQAYRASILHFLSDPGSSNDPRAPQYFEDGLLVVDGGHVVAVGPAQALLATLPAGAPVTDLRPRLILPGFVDTHIHYPQTDVIASYGTQLLDWLERYTFPAERRFDDAAHARAVCEFFFDELLRNGTTTALVFGTVHRLSIDVFFEAAQARGLRMIAGKVLMDRNCPSDLRDTPRDGVRESQQLIERWHGTGRLVTTIISARNLSKHICQSSQLEYRNAATLVDRCSFENCGTIRVLTAHPNIKSGFG